MPKIIKNLEQSLLDTAKRIIEQEGYSALSMRRLADECHVALGTIYNYIEGKDKIVAMLMATDWKITIEQMTKAQESKDFVKGYGLIYDAILEFCNKNMRTWTDYAKQGGTYMANSEMHRRLQDQVAGHVKALLKNTGNDDLCKCTLLLAETVVAAAVQTNIPKTQLTALAKKLTK